MKNIDLKLPSDFPSFQKWQNHDAFYRQKITKAENALNSEQQKYAELVDRKHELYMKSDDTEAKREVKEALEQSEKAIDKKQQALDDLRKEAEQAERKDAELKQAFLEEVADSGYLPNLADEYLEVLQKAVALNETIQAWRGRTIRSDLRTPSTAQVNFEESNKEEQISALKDRMQRIKSGDYINRDLKEYQSNN